MTQDDFEWTDEERDGLRSYGANVTPSETLRQRTTNALRERNLLKGPRRTRVIRPVVGIAAAIAVFAAAASYLIDRSGDTQGIAAGDTTRLTATTKKIERHIIWY